MSAKYIYFEILAINSLYHQNTSVYILIGEK